MLPVFFDHYTDFVQCGELGIRNSQTQQYRLNAYVNKTSHNLYTFNIDFILSVRFMKIKGETFPTWTLFHRFLLFFFKQCKRLSVLLASNFITISEQRFRAQLHLTCNVTAMFYYRPHPKVAGM